MWSDSDDEVVPVLFSIIEVCEQNETNNTEYREWWVHPHNRKRDAEDVIKKEIAKLRNNPAEFRNFVNMQTETFDYLLSLIENSIAKQDTHYRKSISPAERLFITLRYLASGERFKKLESHFHCGASTIEKIVMETCKAIWKTLSPIYLPEPDLGKWMSIADAFGRMWNFPSCLGAIDGKHIRINCPSQSADYYKYRKFRSIHLQAVVDAHGQFICVDVGDFEGNYDSAVFKHSNFGKKLINKELNLPQKQKLCLESDEDFPFVFVADESYPLLMDVMKPFARENLTSERSIYNYRLSRARRVADCAFGMLTKRFSILDILIWLPPNKVQTITLAACALHNMIREREILLGEIYAERDAMEDLAQAETTVPDENIQNTKPSNAARHIRNQFTSYFNSATGSVPWQVKYAN